VLLHIKLVSKQNFGLDFSVKEKKKRGDQGKLEFLKKRPAEVGNLKENNCRQEES